MALKKYLEGDYENSISYTSHVIDNYSMEFNWLLGLSYFLRGESLLKLNRINESKIDFKFVSKLDFKFPEKEKATKNHQNTKTSILDYLKIKPTFVRIKLQTLLSKAPVQKIHNWTIAKLFMPSSCLK